MVWPPTTHQDVQDEITPLRLAHRDYLKTGYYTTGTWAYPAPVNSTIFADQITVRPFLVYAERTFDRIGIHVNTAATAASGGTIGLALYAPGAGQPSDLIASTAQVSTETTGPKEFTISVTLTPGVYWVGVMAKVAGCGIPAVNAGVNPWLGGTVPHPVTSGSHQAWNYQGAALAAWPTTWPASPSASVATFANTHLVGLRAA